MTDFATGWLADLFGADVKKAIGKTHATRWNDEPWALGAFSAAAVERAAGARKVLMEPVRDRLFFAGEACTRRCGARSAAPGSRASAPPTRRCGCGASAMTCATAERRLIAWSSGKDSRLGAARGAPRRRLRRRRRAHDRDRDLRARQHAWRARGDLARAA